MNACALRYGEVGIAQMDSAHGDILKYVELLKQKRSIEEEKILLRQVFDIAIFHSIKEEDLADLYDYPAAESYKKAHSDFLMNLSLYADWNNGFIFRKSEFVDFAVDWVSSHIAQQDIPLSKHIKSLQAIYY